MLTQHHGDLAGTKSDGPCRIRPETNPFNMFAKSLNVLTVKNPRLHARSNVHRHKVMASTYWSLAPKKEKATFFQNVASTVIDLTGSIGRKRVCSIGAKDYVQNEPIDFTIIDHGGIHVLFESESDHINPLDSPSTLYITDVDSSSEVYVDGILVPKGKRIKCRPGAHVHLGDADFVVQRNVVAHA